MVSEVKTGNSRLARTKTGLQMTHEWTAPRLKFRANQYRLLSLDLSKGGIRLARAPSGLARKQMLEVPYGKDGSALFWRETNQSSWNLSAKPDQTAIVQRQVGRIAQWLDGVADGRIDYRRRIYRDRITNGKLITTVKDASLLDAGVPESKLPVLHRVEVPYKAGGPIGQSLTKAWAEELRRTNPMLNDREVLSQAREEARNTLARKLNFKPMSLGQSLAKGAGMSAVSGGVLAGAIDMGMQLVSTGEVDFKQVGANTLVGGAAGATGYLAGSGATYALTNTTLGLNLSRQLATSIGITTSCSANLLGSAVGGGLAAAVFSYGLYFMGYADLETANRMTVAGVAGSVAGAAVIYSLGGAAATSAAMTTIAGGSAVAGSILAATGVGLVVVGVGAGITWFFTAYDAAQETKRLELTGEYLSEHYGKLAE
jgi:hypothetical protein